MAQKEEAVVGAWHRTRVTELPVSSQGCGTDTSRPRQEQEVVMGRDTTPCLLSDAKRGDSRIRKSREVA